MSARGYVYMMMNRFNTVIYTGVTSDLWRRVNEHKEGKIEGFTKRYRVHKLVFYESFLTMREAIDAEKKIKAGSRAKKVLLIKTMNPDFKDLMLGDCHAPILDQKTKTNWDSTGFRYKFNESQAPYKTGLAKTLNGE
ncbi:MAG: GIY-YIG nuclease family protein [Candidatus Omnitrophota bacterium]